MDDIQLRFLTTQALYAKDLQERNAAVRQLRTGGLTDSELEAVSVRLELAMACQDEYVRSAAALLLAGLAEQVPVSRTLADGLLELSRRQNAFPREAALRAIKRICKVGRDLSLEDSQALEERLEEARRLEPEVFALSLFDEP